MVGDPLRNLVLEIFYRVPLHESVGTRDPIPILHTHTITPSYFVPSYTLVSEYHHSCMTSTVVCRVIHSSVDMSHDVKIYISFFCLEPPFTKVKLVDLLA